MSPKLVAGAFAMALAVTAVPAGAEPRAFDSPEAVLEEVVAALEARDRDRLIAVFGPENESLVLSGDPERDREDWTNFMRAYKEMHRIAIQEDGTARIYIGRTQYPVAAPLVKGPDGKWRIDVAAAREEILDRRIGRNELDVIELLGAYVGVQRKFRQTDYDGDGVMEFAARIVSSAKDRDGLYWPSTEGVPDSPVGDFVARANATGHRIGETDAEPEPYLGYYYRLLQKQGEAAPGGAMSYIVNGNMVAGHALLAFPAAYGETGIMSFLVGENGIVYEADLGEDTAKVAAEIDSYNPGEGWAPVGE